MVKRYNLIKLIDSDPSEEKQKEYDNMSGEELTNLILKEYSISDIRKYLVVKDLIFIQGIKNKDNLYTNLGLLVSNECPFHGLLYAATNLVRSLIPTTYLREARKVRRLCPPQAVSEVTPHYSVAVSLIYLSVFTVCFN